MKSTNNDKELRETELAKTVYAICDDLAEGAHRAFGDSDMYIDWVENSTEKLLALITKSNKKAVIEKLQEYIGRIDNYKPDPSAPSFGSASGAMEIAGWRNAFEQDIATIKKLK